MHNPLRLVHLGVHRRGNLRERLRGTDGCGKRQFLGGQWNLLDTFVALAGILGFAFRNKVFSMIEGIYKSEKYKTLAAYKQKN